MVQTPVADWRYSRGLPLTSHQARCARAAVGAGQPVRLTAVHQSTSSQFPRVPTHLLVVSPISCACHLPPLLPPSTIPPRVKPAFPLESLSVVSGGTYQNANAVIRRPRPPGASLDHQNILPGNVTTTTPSPRWLSFLLGERCALSHRTERVVT